MITKSRATLLGLLVSGMFMAQPALAAPFTVTAWGTGYNAVNVAAPTYNGSGGGFKMQEWANVGSTVGNIAVGTSFISWCIDLGEYINSSAMNFAVNDPGFSGLNATQRANLIRLASGHLVAATAPAANSISDVSAAFQLAVWEIRFETSTGPYDIASGAFRSTTTTAASNLAGTWLSSLNSFSSTAYTLNTYTTVGAQDQISFRRTPGSGSCEVCFDDVPEPATLSLLGIGLIGLGYIRRKSAKASRA